MDSEHQNKNEFAEQIIENFRQSHSKSNDIIVDDCSMAERAMAYACGDVSSRRSHEVEKHINTCNFCTGLVLDTRLAEWEARELGDQAPDVLPAFSNAIHKPADQPSMPFFLKHLAALCSKFWSFLLSPRVMAALATASLAFIIINYGLNDTEILEKSVMSREKDQPQKKMAPQLVKPSTGAPNRQKDFNPGAPGALNDYDRKEHINSFKPLYEGKPDAAKVRRLKKSRIPRTPLEKIDISQLKLVGIVVSADGNKALLESASGKGYVVQEGAHIGTKAGKIVQIKKDRIVIEEEVEDELGNLKIRKIELKLYNKK